VGSSPVFRDLHPRLSAVERSSKPVDAFTEILKLIDGSKGLPDPSKTPPDRDLIAM
jgi:hypothetical protein